MRKLYAQMLVRTNEDIFAYCAELSLEFRAQGGGHHCIDEDGVPDLAVLLPWFFEDVLGGDEAVQYELPEPVREMDHVVVMFFLVHCGHDLAHLCLDGRVVSPLPVLKCVLMQR